MIKAKKTSVRDDYMELIQEFPLKAIRNHAELERAGEMLTQLVTSKPSERMSEGEKDYLEALVVLIRDAEGAILARLTKNLKPLDLLKYLMEEAGMNTNDLGKIVGSQSNASMILNRKRPLSKENILRLAEHFNLSAAAFLG